MKIVKARYDAEDLIDLLVRQSDSDTERTYWERLRQKPLTVEINEYSPSHTQEQEGLYRAAVRRLGQAIGYTGKDAEDAIHNAVLCQAFGVEKTIKIAGQVYEVPMRRSTKLGIRDYSYMIGVLGRMAEEMGVQIGVTI